MSDWKEYIVVPSTGSGTTSTGSGTTVMSSGTTSTKETVPSTSSGTDTLPVAEPVEATVEATIVS